VAQGIGRPPESIPARLTSLRHGLNGGIGLLLLIVLVLVLLGRL
jgi:hypothetical protein